MAVPLEVVYEQQESSFGGSGATDEQTLLIGAPK
jgi:hypothetical protein